MAIIPPHIKATTKTDCIDTWRSRGRIVVPTRKGRLVDLMIVRLYECTAEDGLGLDCLIGARTAKRAPV